MVKPKNRMRDPIGRKFLFGNASHSESRMSTRADDYRRRAHAADHRAAQTSDPHIRSAYEQLCRDWLTLAEQAEWLDSAKAPADHRKPKA
jgi:hypothetical protein